MKVLIKDAIILSPASPFHRQSKDILIENGIISEIGNKLNTSGGQVIEKEGLHVSCGWMDCFANFCDPGYEYKETLETGAMAAAAGGFTQVMLMPNTRPFVHDKSQVEYIIQKSKQLPVSIFPIGSVTKNGEGKELAEMYDMYNSGAIAFSDGLLPIQSSGIMQKSLQYLLAINATVIQVPDDKSIGFGGLMNEGVVSTRLGLQGKPAIAEEIFIARDIELAKYTGSKIHFTGVTTKKSLELIAAAKKEKINVSCSVTPYHLFFCDDDLLNYDTNLKVNPPLRTKEDNNALKEGIKNATVDFIASHHQPQDWDHKVCEFEYAKDGMEGLESVYGVARICGITSGGFVKMQTENIRNIFNLAVPVINKNEPANLTLFNTDEEYTFEEKNIYSKCKNNAFVGKTLKGKVIGIINGDKVFLK
ncbi:MAG TPA: dihydroorotase [Chitinophagaceae bacterium]|nr:dihydroorotase [Chitinophagaceae bacterium]